MNYPCGSVPKTTLMEQGHNSGYGETWSDAPDLESGVENDT